MVVAPKHVDVRGGVCGWTAEDGTPCHKPLAFGQCLGRDGVAHGQRHGLPPLPLGAEHTTRKVDGRSVAGRAIRAARATA